MKKLILLALLAMLNSVAFAATPDNSLRIPQITMDDEDSVDTIKEYRAEKQERDPD